MSGCDVPVHIDQIDYAIAKVFPAPCHTALIEKYAGACDCDHGEDDPCCTETETPESDRPRDDL